MKTNIIKFTALLVIIAGGMLACNDSDPQPKGNENPEDSILCTFENPLTDLLWLKETIEEFQEITDITVAIYQCVLENDNIGFLVEEDEKQRLYNCQGEIYSEELNIVSQKLIWEKDNIEDIWVWENVHDANNIITLSIHKNTVSVSKSPKEDGDYDQFHQFRNGDQYLLQNDTLYLKNLDGTICFSHHCTFAITRLVEDEMELEYLGILPDYPLYIRNYLFNRKIVE